MREQAGHDLDLNKWMSFYSFDLIGDLSFGKSFGCLDNGTFHHWVAVMFDSVQAGLILLALREYAVGRVVLKFFMPKFLHDAMEEHKNFSRSSTRKRLEAGITDRKDYVSLMLTESKEGNCMNVAEMMESTQLFILAGSETVSSAMTALLYLLCNNPDAYQKAVQEVRTAFKNEDEINLARCFKEVPYLDACIEEALRLLPPAATMHYRVINPGGVWIDEKLIPAGVSTHYNPC